MKPLALLLALSACASPAPISRIGSIPVSPGYLPAYDPLQWSMSIYDAATSRMLLVRVAVFPSEEDCEAEGETLRNPDVYAVCRPVPNA